jgi:L-threonylcarbamoyladenylate synthase
VSSKPKARILSPLPENFQIASDAIKRGEVVGMPTETVYGLAGDAFNPLALARIFETKERPTFDPLIIHVGLFAKRVEDLARLELVDLKKLSETAQKRANTLIQAFWPGPLTLVLPKAEKVPDLATSGLPTVAVRMPRHSVAQALIAASQTPLAAPSANRFGRISPTSAQDVSDELGDRIDWILDGGRCEVGLESTIISVGENGDLTLLRPGGLAPEKIEEVAGVKLVIRPASASPGKVSSVLAPGMLESHYAPVKKLILLPDALALKMKFPPSTRIAFLSLFGNPDEASEEFEKSFGIKPQVFVLSESGNVGEAARNLFRILREMDASDAEILIAKPCLLVQGLGYAIGDRLRRASSNS